MALRDGYRMPTQLPLDGCWSPSSVSEALIHVGIIHQHCRSRQGQHSAPGWWQEPLFGLRYPLPLLIMGFSEMELEMGC